MVYLMAAGVVVQCDTCKNYGPTVGDGKMPHHWIYTIVAGLTGPRHFCSTICAENYFKSQRTGDAHGPGPQL